MFVFAFLGLWQRCIIPWRQPRDGYIRALDMTKVCRVLGRDTIDYRNYSSRIDLGAVKLRNRAGNDETSWEFSRGKWMLVIVGILHICICTCRLALFSFVVVIN